MNTLSQEDFSICAASKDFYKCISSSVGIDHPFTLRKDTIDNISTSPVTWFTWLPTQNNNDHFSMAFPPGWKRADADEYARTWELIGQDDAGNTVTVGRFILKNWLPYDPSETLEGFANNIIRTYPAENKLHTTLPQSTNGIPSFTAIGNSTEDGRRFLLITKFIKVSNNDHQFSFFGDAGMSGYMTAVLGAMADSITNNRGR